MLHLLLEDNGVHTKHCWCVCLYRYVYSVDKMIFAFLFVIYFIVSQSGVSQT